MTKQPKTLGRKLAVAALLPLSVAMLLIAGTSASRESQRYLDGRQREAHAIANIFSASVAEALVANDRPRAIHSLRAIGAIDGIQHVKVNDRAGREWLSLGDGVALNSGSAKDKNGGLRALFAGNPVEISAPIVKAGQPIGTLHLLISTHQVRRQLIESILQAIAIAAMAAAGAQILVLRLQARVLRPMRELTDAMGAVESEQRFDFKLDNASDDETGQLVQSFNTMLARIRDRDERLADYRLSLERKVDERTRDLREAKDAAEAATKAKSEFLATMSHEIRTPMNGMMVMSEILATAELPARYRHYAELVVRSGRTLLAIINDVLDFSKIEAGGLVLEATDTDPRGVITDVVQLFGEQARAKGIDLAARFGSAIPLLVTSDPVRLSQVVGNLVNNAIKFTESGHIEVNADFQSDADRHGILRVSVIDTGIGISEDGLTRIFDSFTQADQSTTRKYGGTGLGLAICMKLVKAMGGDISASSTPGKGTRFDVTVPLEIVTNAPAVLPLPASERALVACRAPLSRDVIGGALAARGFEVTAVESAADCPKEQRFDLIVGDSQTLETIDAAGYSSRETIVLSEIGDFSAERLVAAGRAGAVLMRPVTTAACYAALEALLVPAEDRAQSRYAPTARVARLSPFANLRVLVADDSAVNREVVSLAMAQMGIAPDMVMNGLQAVAKFRANSYDIVFMDASMPDVDGFATTAMLREIELETGRARTPVIALTAHAMRHIADRIAESGMDGHLLKPFTLGTLRSALERHCPGSAKPAPADERMARIAAGNDDVIDHQTLSNLEEIAGTGAHEIVGKLYDMFQESAPPAMKRLRDAIRAGNSADIAHAAHALKSMALNMAAGRLSRRLALIEERSRSSAASISPDDAEAVASDLSTALAELARIMRARDALPDTAQAR